MDQRDEIDNAIEECRKYITTRTRQCQYIIWYQVVFVCIGFFFFWVFDISFLAPIRRDAADSVSSRAAGNPITLIVFNRNIGASETAVREFDGASPAAAQNGETESVNGVTSKQGVSGQSNSVKDNKPSAASATGSSLANTLIIALIGFYGMAASTLMVSFRSFHRDIDKAQRMKMGFLRIHVAGERKEKGYQSEVRIALTKGAFILSDEYLSSRGGKGNGLFPSHLLTDLIVRVLEALEKWLKPKSGSSGGKAKP